MLACEAGDPGSIPGESTSQKNREIAVFLTYADFFIIAEILDFFLEAVLALRSPVFTDLSKICWISAMEARASLIFFSETSFLIFLTALFRSSFLAMLNSLFLLEPRRAFFADIVMGMTKIVADKPFFSNFLSIANLLTFHVCMIQYWRLVRCKSPN